MKNKLKRECWIISILKVYVAPNAKQACRRRTRNFRKTGTSRLQVYRCKHCASVYTLYSQTVFAGTQLYPSQVVLLLHGVCQGVSSAQLGRELGLSRQTVLSLRRKLQSSAEQLQPEAALPNAEVETDEMFQNAGEKAEQRNKGRKPPTGCAGVDAEVSDTSASTPNPYSYGDRHIDASDTPRRRGNHKRRGHGTYENDRPPIVGTKGRERGLLR